MKISNLALCLLFAYGTNSNAAILATGSTGPGSGLFSVDNENGTAELIGNTGDLSHLAFYGFAYAQSTDTLYATGYDKTSSYYYAAWAPALFSIDQLTGSAELIGHLDPNEYDWMRNGGGGLAWDNLTSRLYATGTTPDPLDGYRSAFYEININTGEASLISRNPYSIHGGGLAYDSTRDILFATGYTPTGSNSGLYTIDRITGIPTFVGKLADGNGLTHGGLAYSAENDVLYASGWEGTGDPTADDDSALFSIDPDTAEITFIGYTGSAGYLYSGGLAVTPVPLPATIWLFASGLLGLVGIARRKAAA